MNYQFTKWFVIFFSLLISSSACFAQLTGVKTIPGDYATVSAAITDLNTQGVGAGGVIFNIAAGYTETTAATLSITATGTAANTIVFQKFGAGANPLITAYTGGTGTPATAVQDGIWNLVGADFITIDGIDLTENGANAAGSLMEYGYALYKASATNGSQHVTIKNCVVTLNRNNVTAGVAPMLDGSVGILSINSTATAATTALAVSTTGGSNSFNQFYSNTIQNTNIGIGLSGFVAASPYTLADIGNDIGGTALSTGNTIKNFGGGTGTADTAAGIITAAQYDLNIAYNTINSNDGGGITHNNTIRGIYNKAAAGASASITNNTVTVLTAIPNAVTNANTRLTAIENDGGSGGTSNVITISNNTITNCLFNYAYTSSTTTNGMFGILNTASPSKLSVKQNVFSGNSTNSVVSNGQTSMIYNRGAVKDSLTVDGNNFNSLNLTATASSANNIKFIFNFPPSYNANCATTFTNNTLAGAGVTFGGGFVGIGSFAMLFNVEEGSSLLISGNSITNVSAPFTTGQVYGYYNNANSGSTDAPVVRIINNNINGLNKTGASGGAVYGIFEQPKTSLGTGSVLIDNNNFSNVSNAGTGNTAGTYITTASSSQPITFSNNTFTNFTAGATASFYGFYGSAGGPGSSVHHNVCSAFSSAGNAIGFFLGNGNIAIGHNIYSNTLYNFSSTGGGNSITGMHLTQGRDMNFYKNKIYNFLETGTGGRVYGMNINSMLSASGTTINITNNLISDLRTPNSTAFTQGTASPFAAGTDAISAIYLSAASANSLLATINVSYNTILLNATSTGANFHTSGIYQTAMPLATTNKLVLRNNIIINNSTPNGTGIASAIRRSYAGATFNFDALSDNNALYAGTPGTNNVLYTDGTNSYQNITQYHNALIPQGAHTVTDNVTFLSTAGASPDFLRPDPAVITPIESGGVSIAGITDDYTGAVRNAVTPDIGAYEGNYTAIDTVPPIIMYTALNNTASTTSRVAASFATITDPSSVNITAGTKPRIYYKKSTDADAIAGNTSADNGWKYTEATNAASPFSFIIDYSLLQTPVVTGDSISYLVVAQDLVATPNAGPNSSVLFSAKPLSVALAGIQTPVLGSISGYKITPGLDGDILVGTDQPVYQSLTNPGGLFEAINNGTVTGNINAMVTTDLLAETGTFSLNKWNEEGAGNFNVSISPSDAVERLIEGSGLILINLYGAKNVKFDGSFGGSGKYFRIRNTNTGAASTFLYNRDAKRDTLMNCYIEGAGNTSGGTIIIGASTLVGGTGIDSIVIANNIIRDLSSAAGVPAYLVKCSANSGWEDDNCEVTGNEFMNWTNDAFSIASSNFGGSNWIISNNSFYQTAPRTTVVHAIRFYANGGGGHLVSGNSIGGSAPDRSGNPITSTTTSTFGMAGIYSVSGSTNPITITNNIISNLYQSNGTIGSPSVYGIYISGGTATVSGNTIGGGMQPYDTIRSSGLGGIVVGISAGGNVTVTNNLVKNLANSTSGTNTVAGIQAFGSGYFIDNNIIDSIRGNSTYNNVNVNSSTIPVGILITSGGSMGMNIVSNNRVSNIISLNTLATNTAPVVVAGIAATSGVTAPIKVFNNKVLNVYGFNTTANLGNNVFGIADVGGVNANNSYYNNQVILGTNITSQSWVRGIALTSSLGTANNFSFYNNSVYVNATLNNTNGAAAFYRLNAIPVTLRNNLFYNASTNAGAGVVAAIHNNSTAVGWSSTASDYNLTYTANPAALNYWGPSASALSYSNWITASAGDLNSVTGDVPFLSATDLHIDGTNANAWNVFGRGIALPGLVSNDYDGNARSTTVGVPTTIGFDEIAIPSSVPADMIVTPATPVVGTPTVFTSAGRKIAEINWTGATAATSLSAKYYPGVQAPGTPVGWTYEYSHIVITATPDNGDPYIAKIYYTHAEDNTIADLTMNSIKKHNANPYVDMGIAGTSTTDAFGRFVTTSTANDFSIITLSNRPGALAIQLLAITAVNSGSSNKVSWSTAEESVGDKFELESSRDGASFSLLSAIAVNGQPSGYTYLHNNAAPGKTYYRLKMLNAAGGIAYSKIVWAVVKAADNFEFTAYPNPVQNNVHIKITGALQADAAIQIADVSGRQLQAVKVTGNLMHIDMRSYSPGVYFIKYTDGLQSRILKVIKQ